MQPAQQAEALSPWVGAATPNGSIVRRYEPLDNLRRNAAGPYDEARDSLSLAADAGNVSRLATAPASTVAKTARNIESIEDFSKVPADASVIVARMHEVAQFQTWLVFSRLDAPAGDSQGPPYFMVASPLRPFWNRSAPNEKTYAFVVPPGHWRITSSSLIDFCLGAPGFDLRAGEALFAGSFDGNHPYAPDLSLETVKPALGESDLARRLKPVQYAGGETFPCDALPQTFLYVLKFPTIPATAN